MIRLSNGVELDFLAASGALGFDGRGWPWEWPHRWLGKLRPQEFAIVVKTLTLRPRRGNLRWYRPWSSIRLLRDGVVNAVGLTNPGLDWWIHSCYPRMRRSGYTTIVSVFPGTPEEAGEMAVRLRDLEVAAVELNASCPNTGHEIAAADEVIRLGERLTESKHPLIVKLSVGHPFGRLARDLDGVAEAITAINSVPWNMIYGDQRSPLAGLGGGGVSGPPVRAFARRAVEELVTSGHIPVIAGGGIYTAADIKEMECIGASAFAFGTLFLRSPGVPNRLAVEYRAMTPAAKGQQATGQNDQRSSADAPSGS